MKDTTMQAMFTELQKAEAALYDALKAGASDNMVGNVDLETTNDALCMVQCAIQELRMRKSGMTKVAR